MNVEAIKTIEYEFRPPWYDLFRSYFWSNFLTIRTIFLKSLYLSVNSFILYTEEMAREALDIGYYYYG